MTDVQAIATLLQAKSGRKDYEAFDKGAEAISKLNRIKAITERALRSSDPINLYKARAIEDIAKLLGIEIKAPISDGKDINQITIDEFI